ncbi:STAS domain-containing protein [Schlesneria paludicola]|uniref:STAS domain-containing protein n=1 Tax=Schlesneria paludicola TaxID=360056 RepID=UPI00029B14CE|nr:STAS domain-containing protein [Schlesneria paludicola]
MKFSVSEDQGEVAKVVVNGCLGQPDIAPPLDPFRQVLGPEAYKRIVLLDMKDSNYLDSMCIGWLLSAHKRFRENGGKLVIHSLQPLATNVISLLHLNGVFLLAADGAKAMQLAKGEVA